MMINDLFESSLNKWRANKGKGWELVPPPLDARYLLYGTLLKVYNKNENLSVLIIVDTFADRCNLIDFLTNRHDVNDKEFKKLIADKTLKIYTPDIIQRMMYKPTVTLCICFNIDKITTVHLDYFASTKWCFVILSKTMDIGSMYNLNGIPHLNTFTQDVIDKIRTTFPVEEWRVGVDIPEESKDAMAIRTYDDYIMESMRIFGSFDVMKTARFGDSSVSMSAAMVCEQLARENGWDENLDMSYPFNVQIDAVYNPNTIRERASLTYDFIRNRNNLLSDSDYKLPIIADIVANNANKRILIINKRGDFASKVSRHLNEQFGEDTSLPCHPTLETIPAVDEYGHPVLYKSGVNKGKQRSYGAIAQCNIAIDRFNRGKIHVLCVNNAPITSLCIDIDIVIITSPMCEDIASYFYRLSYCSFTNPLCLYSLYVKNSVEESRLRNKKLAENHIIKEDIKNDVMSENNFDFVIVD